jgi:hypothetical protein
VSARLVISTALVFNSSQPEHLVIEYNGEDGIGRVVGQCFTLEDAFKCAHARESEREQSALPSLVVEDRHSNKRTQ